MDAFEKLAKLAGASVESVGEGLPRTPAEAKALGSMYYFTGNPCKLGHVALRWTTNKACRECSIRKSQQNNARPERKEYMRQRNARPEVKELKRKCGTTPESMERKRQASRIRGALPSTKSYEQQRGLRKTGDEILFSINQAFRAANLGIASLDIVPQCPEPQRSQLQALVDRIKADPQAGKAVVGLLRTTRELRKAELAEMKAGLDAG